MTDGPFAEGKEYLGGFAIIDVTDLDEALRWGTEFAEITGLPTEVRLALTDGIRLDGYYLLPAIRADLLARLGRTADATAEHAAAAQLTDSSAQRRFLEGRRAWCDGRAG